MNLADVLGAKVALTFGGIAVDGAVEKVGGVCLAYVEGEDEPCGVFVADGEDHEHSGRRTPAAQGVTDDGRTFVLRLTDGRPDDFSRADSTDLGGGWTLR